MRLYLSKPFFDGHIDRGFPFGGGFTWQKMNLRFAEPMHGLQNSW